MLPTVSDYKHEWIHFFLLIIFTIFFEHIQAQSLDQIIITLEQQLELNAKIKANVLREQTWNS